MVVLDVFSRRGCHLCEVMIEEILPLIEGRATLEVHDIDSRQEWRDAYDIRIPVLEQDGSFICEYQLDRDALEAALVKAAEGGE